MPARIIDRPAIGIAMLAIAFLVHLPVHAQANLRAIGAAIAPPELVAAYNCTTYAEFAFMPKVQVRTRQMLEKGPDKQALLKRMLSRYDSLLNAMCREVVVVFQQRRDMVLDVYARQLPGNQSDIAPLLANPRGTHWAAKNSTFLAATTPLIQYHALVKFAAPQLLKSSQAVSPMTFMYLDQEKKTDLESASTGMSARHERAQLMVILADEGFSELMPSRFDFRSLQQEEASLRREAVGLRYSTTFPWFNDNASELIRMHFNQFDAMREIGVADVYLKYGGKLEELLRQE